MLSQTFKAIRKQLQLVIIFIFCIYFLGSTNAEEWTVRNDGTGDTDNIDDAISWANSGDSIFIGPGTFSTQAYINKELLINGDGIDSTFINCYGDTSSYVFNIGVGNVVLEDFSLNDQTNCGSVRVHNLAEEVVIKNIKVYNVYSNAFEFDSNTKVTLKNSIIGVEGKSISSTGLSVYGKESTIDNNVFYGNSLYIQGENNQITNNQITSTTSWSINLNGNNNFLSGNTVSNSPENKEDEGGSRDTAFNYLVGTRTDSKIEFDWTSNNFFAQQDTDYFGVVWESTFYVEDEGGNGSNGDYVEFEMYAGDGYRITIDGNVWDDYLDCYGAISQSYGQSMTSGTHTIKIEFLECEGDARAYLDWDTYGNEPQAFQGKYYDHSPPADAVVTDFKSIYIGSTQNTVDETNTFENSKFIMYYQVNDKSLYELNLGAKKVSNYDYKIYISQSEDISIDAVVFNYPAFVQSQSSNSITIKNCDFRNGRLILNGDNNIIENNSFLTILPEGNNLREIQVNGNQNTVKFNTVFNGIDVTGNFNEINDNMVNMGIGNGISIVGNGGNISYNEVTNASNHGIFIDGYDQIIDGNKILSSMNYALYLGTMNGNTVTEANELKGSCVVLYSNLIRTKENKKVIQNCEFTGGDIWNLDAAFNIISSNNITFNSNRVSDELINNSKGIYIAYSKDISISNSNFIGLEMGIESYSNELLNIKDSTFTNCKQGIVNLYSGDIIIENNNFRNSAVAGINLADTVFFTIGENELRNDRDRDMLGSGIGVVVTNSIHGTITNNEITGFDIAGMVYTTVSYLKTENNKIHDNGVGIDLYSISNRVYLKIQYNDIYDNQQYGIYSDSPVDARFNWWGDPTGPYQRCESQEGCEGNVNIEGKGNPVNSNIDASEQLYGSGQGFTIVNSIQSIGYQYKFPIILFIGLAIVGIIAKRRGWFDKWGDNTFAPKNAYPMAAPISKTSTSKKTTSKNIKSSDTITIECTNCSEKIKLQDKKGKQKIVCSGCGTSGEIEI